MHVALARIGDRAEPPGQHPDPAGREVGDDRRGQPDERELTQRDTRAPIGEREQSAGHVALGATVLDEGDVRCTVRASTATWAVGRCGLIRP